MGARLVMRALKEMAGEVDIPTAHRLTLVVMAAHAMDTPGRGHPARVYWGGHRQLAREVYGTTWDGAIETANQMRQVRRIIRDLEIRKLIMPHDTTPGYNRAYLLFPNGEAGGEGVLPPGGEGQ